MKAKTDTKYLSKLFQNSYHPTTTAAELPDRKQAASALGAYATAIRTKEREQSSKFAHVHFFLIETARVLLAKQRENH